MGISVFNGSTLKFLMVLCLYRQTIPVGKGFDELGTVIPIVVFLVHETLGDIPHEMAGGNLKCLW